MFGTLIAMGAFGIEECDPCSQCGETTIMCWCNRTEHCESCGEYWKWCSCEREGIDVIGTDMLKHVYLCKLVRS